MTGAYVGGLRDRLIHDSAFFFVHSGLYELGWFDAGRTHAPVNMLPEFKGWDEELPPNTVTVSAAGQSDEDMELGSFGKKNTLIYYADVYGENETVGMQLSGDVRDILRGKFSGLTDTPAELPVYDYTQPTPVQIFYCDIQRVTRDRAQNFPNRWQRYFWMVKFELVDYYNDDAVPEQFVGDPLGPIAP